MSKSITFEVHNVEITPAGRSEVCIVCSVNEYFLTNNFETNEIVEAFGAEELLKEIGEEEAARYFWLTSKEQESGDE